MWVKREIAVKRWGMWVASLCAFLILLRLPALLNPILDADEAIFGMFARIWFDGGIPYLDCVETKPLGIYLLYGLLFSIFGKFNMIAVHAATIAIVGATAYVIYLIADHLHVIARSDSSEAIPLSSWDRHARLPRARDDRRIGLWAALLYIVFSTTYIPKYIATMIEPVMLLPATLQFYLWLKFEREGRGWQACLSGMAFSAACLFKYQAGINLVVLIAWIAAIKPILERRMPSRADSRGLAWFIVGSVPLPAIMVAYLWKIGGLDAFWFWNIAGNLEYIDEGSSGMGLMRQVATRVLPFVASTALLWVLCAARASRLVRQTRDAQPETANREWLVLLWFAMSCIPVSMGRRFYGHYFILLLPPMAILGSRVLDEVWSSSGRAWVRKMALFWMIFPATGFFAARFFIPAIVRAAGEDNMADYRPLAEYVARRTLPTDRIVAWGNAPAIYWYAQRYPGTRFFWSDLLSGRVRGIRGAPSASASGIPEAWDMFIEDMDRHRPTYLIDTSPAGLHDYQFYPMGNYPRLMQYVARHYREETRISGAVFYRRSD